MMTPEEQAIADDFERGWSDERIRAAHKEYGPGIRHMIPEEIMKKIREQADREGTRELDVINEALAAYFDNKAA